MTLNAPDRDDNVTAEERELFDSLSFCILPTTRGDLAVMADPAQVHMLPMSSRSARRVTDVSRQDHERPWILCGKRLYTSSDDHARVLAFDLPSEPLGTAADLDAIVGSALAGQREDSDIWVVNTPEGAEIHRLVEGHLTMLGRMSGGLHTTVCTDEGELAAGSCPNLDDEATGQPLLVDLRSGARFQMQGLNEAIQQWCVAPGHVALPPGYGIGRLYCDAFLGMDVQAGRGVRLVGGLAEATLPQDLSAGLSCKTAIPGVLDYTGMVHFGFAAGEIRLLHVDWEHRFIDTVRVAGHTRLYTAKRTSALRPSLKDLHLCDDLFDGVEAKRTPLTFERISPNIEFNKFSVAYRAGRGYLAVANVHWGFTAGKFAPRDVILTSEDGVGWRCVDGA